MYRDIKEYDYAIGTLKSIMQEKGSALSGNYESDSIIVGDLRALNFAIMILISNRSSLLNELCKLPK